MKIAITADVHLRTQTETPERYNALESIFKEIQQRGIKNLLIAGDTFDKEFSNYHDFNLLCEKYKEIQVTVIPGNHDPEIEKKFFTADNLEIINKPLIKKISGLDILFLPYTLTKTMDEVLTDYFYNNTNPDRWLLLGHGDYISVNRQMNPYEPGFYMPISSKAIDKYNPLYVILGHIHKPSEIGRVICPGSPSGLDITETGKRKFIIYDIKTNNIEKAFVQTDTIYIIESVLTYPIDDEAESLKGRINQIIVNWGLTKEELSKVKLRLIIKGFTKDLKDLKNIISNHLEECGISLYEVEGLDLSSIKVMKDTDEELIILLNKVNEKIGDIQLQTIETSKDKIIEKAMELIFGK